MVQVLHGLIMKQKMLFQSLLPELLPRSVIVIISSLCVCYLLWVCESGWCLIILCRLHYQVHNNLFLKGFDKMTTVLESDYVIIAKTVYYPLFIF